MFRDLKQVIIPSSNYQEYKNIKYLFILVTKQREYALIAKSQEKMEVWVSAFNYVIESTNII